VSHSRGAAASAVALDVEPSEEDLAAIERAVPPVPPVPPGSAAGDRYDAAQMAHLDSGR
jgi:hypothetical protein